MDIQAVPGMISILYVDDEPSLLEIGKMFLEQNKLFSVDTITSASEALSAIAGKGYDAIISDYHMPGMDGIEFLKCLRASGNTTPFIIFTGRGREEIVIQALNEGADFYLQKGGEPLSQFAELGHKVQIAVMQRRAVASVLDHERREADIINFLPDATFAIDTNGVVIAWNRAMEIMTRVKSSEMLGKSNYEYAIPFYHERRPILIDLVLKDDPITAGKYPILTRDGKALYSEIIIPHFNEGRGAALWFTASPLFDTLGNIVGAIESIRDITERKQAEERILESEQNYRVLFESATDGVLIAQDGRMVNINPALIRLLRRPVEEIISRPFTDFIHPDDRELVMSRHVHRLQGDETPTGYEFRIITGDRQERWVRNNSVRILWSHTPATLSFLTDITGQKLTETRIIAANEEYTRLLDQIQDIYYRSDNEGLLVKASRSFATLLGYDDITECIGRNIADDFYLHPADRKHLLEVISRNGSVTDHELFLKKKDGRPVLISTNSHVYTDKTGNVIGIEGTFRDMTERKKTENALRESEAKYRTLVETANEGVWTIDTDFLTTFTNRKMQQMFGYTAEEMLGRPVWDFVPPDEIESMKQALRMRRLGVPGHYEREWVRKDGTSFWCFTSASPLFSPEGAFVGSFGMFTDITERRHMEETLRESEAKFRAIIDQSYQFIGLLRTDGTLIEANRSALALVGATESDIINRPFWETPWWTHSEDLQKKLKDAIRKAACGETVRFEANHLTADGHLAWIDFSVKPVVDPTGKILFLIPEGRDITGLKCFEDQLIKKNEELNASYEQITATEEELRANLEEMTLQERVIRESEEKFRSLVETSPDIIWEIDSKGIFRYISPQIQAITGYTPEEIIGRPITDLVPEEVRPSAIKELGRLFSKTGSLLPFEVPSRYRDGREMILEIRPALTGTNGINRGFRGVAVDITERKRGEAALRLANRQLKLLGSITRHDILNKVSVILGFLKITGMKFKDPELVMYLETMESTIKDIRSQIEFTKVYENIGTHEPQWIDLDTVMPRTQVPATITFQTAVQGILVFSDPMLEKVFFNLLDNSIKHGEHVTEIRVSSCRSGEDLVIKWEDNGIGIAGDDKERIFERGFGKNTGLGMFLMREILSLTSITISETGAPGKGARFEIIVPKGAWRLREVEQNR